MRRWPDAKRLSLALPAAILLLAVLLLNAPPLRAQSTGPANPAEAAAFLDAYLGDQLARHQIPGAAVVVVQDGQILYSQGYGVADTRTRRPVEAGRTLFHIGSITKLFTWTAVLHLAEQGKLDLHADINTYLPPEAQFSATFPQPVTLAHLLTHTPGFADSLNHLYRISPYDGIPLAQYVVERKPERVLPPGELISYSNYGAGLAGYIVERVAGMPYEDYIEQNILTPLEMQHASIRDPLPAGWEADLALGHLPIMGQMTPLREFFPSSPVVGMVATAEDMGHFMIAHLQAGEYQGRRILQPETARLLLTQQFTHDARVSGVTYGYVVWERDGRRILWHEGSTALFQGLIMLLPEEGVGVFVSYNYKGDSGARREFRQAFLDHYYPAETAAPQPLAGYRERAARFAGFYRESRWSYRTADKFFYLLSRSHEIKANADGTLTLLGDTYVEVAPQFFREVGGQGRLVFQEDVTAPGARAFYDLDPHEALIRLAWYETAPVQLGVLALMGAVFLTALFIPTPRGPAHGFLLSEGRALPRRMAFAALLYPLAMTAIWVTVQARELPDLGFLAPPVVALLLLLLGAALVVMTLAWLERAWTLRERWYFTLVTLTTLGYVIWLEAWNLLGGWRL